MGFNVKPGLLAHQFHPIRQDVDHGQLCLVAVSQRGCMAQGKTGTFREIGCIKNVFDFRKHGVLLYSARLIIPCRLSLSSGFCRRSRTKDTAVNLTYQAADWT